MMDEHRWDPQGFDDDTANGADVDAVHAADRMLDAIAAGGKVDGDDRLVRLLVEARAASERDIPAPPVVDPAQLEDADPQVTSLAGRRRRRAMRRAGGVAALGGVSLTSLLVGSGVAAALVVGGFTVGALTTGNSGDSGQSGSVVAGSAGQDQDGSTGTARRSGGSATESSEPGPGEHGAPADRATDDDTVDPGADAGGMVLAEPESGEDAQSVEQTDTTGDGGTGADGGEVEGDADGAETPGDAAVPGGPMIMAEPQQRGEAAPSKSSSSSSTSPSSTPKAQRDSDEGEPTP